MWNYLSTVYIMTTVVVYTFTVYSMANNKRDDNDDSVADG